RGEAVPQRMWRDALLDPRGLGGGVDGTTELASRQRFDRVAAGEQPAPWQQQAALPPLPPPNAQQFEQLWRQHCMAVLAALAALDAQQHALGIDLADLERDNLRNAQSGAIGGGNAALYFGAVVARSRRVTSSTLSTAGIRRGCGTTVSRRDRSGRSSVTVKK